MALKSHPRLTIQAHGLEVARLPKVAKPGTHRALREPHVPPDRRGLNLERLSAGRKPGQEVEIEPESRAHASQVVGPRMLEDAAIELKGDGLWIGHWMRLGELGKEIPEERGSILSHGPGT